MRPSRTNWLLVRRAQSYATCMETAEQIIHNVLPNADFFINSLLCPVYLIQDIKKPTNKPQNEALFSRYLAVRTITFVAFFLSFLSFEK